MFSKLAFQNVKRSIRDYSVYFLTLTLGVCLFYVFNSMDSQYVMEILTTGNSDMIRTILQLIDIVSLFVSAVLAFLILYANGFMVRRRKKELGTYLLLGLSQWRISALLFLETLLIGLFSLGVGLVLGFFLSQFISVFTAGLFSIEIPEFHFVFSPGALGKTVLYFGIIFLLVMLFNSWSIARQKLIDLLQADRRSETLRLKSLGASVIMFLMGAAMLAIAYAMLLTRGILRVDPLFFLMLALGTAGTLLFFRSLSGFLLRLCRANQKLYYKGLNMFILRQFNSRINTTYVSMTVICLMLLLAIGITACSIGLNNTVEHLVNASAPYDLSITAVIRDQDGAERPADVPAALRHAGFDPDTELARQGTFQTYAAEIRLSGAAEEDAYRVVRLLSLSDLNTVLSFYGEDPMTLPDGHFGLVLGGEYDGTAALLENEAGLMLEESVLLPDPSGVYCAALSIGYGSTPQDYLIIPDTALAAARESTNLHLTNSYFIGNYRDDVPKEKTEERFWSAVKYSSKTESYSRYLLGEHGGSLSTDTRLQIYSETMGSKILVLFIGIYLGIVFLLCSAAVLALQQLSQAADNQRRYAVLARLGVEERMRDRSVYVQVFLAFFLPLALAVVHAVVGMTAANAAIAEVGHLDSAASSIATAGIILVVYGAYFLATCWGSRRIIHSR